MASYQDWTKVAFEVAAEDVPATRVISRAAELWRRDKSKIKAMNMAQARSHGRDVL